MKRAISALAAFLLLLGAGFARAEDLGKPLLLVAAPELQGPYMHTALIVVPMGNRHIGFIINRASNTRLETAFPNHPPSAKVVDPIYFGGPEASDAIFALVRRDPGKPSIRLFGDLFVTGNGTSIDQIIETTPNDARYVAGFVGWQPDELAAEIKKGFWFVGEADPALVFRKDSSHLWEDLVKQYGKVRRVPQPGERETRLRLIERVKIGI
jgi:putative transcriptional regulator